MCLTDLLKLLSCPMGPVAALVKRGFISYGDSGQHDHDQFRILHELSGNVEVLTRCGGHKPCRSCVVSCFRAAVGEHRGAKTVRGNGTAQGG